MKSLITGLLSGYCCLWTATASHAAPVTFQFEGEVAEINSPPGSTFTLPINVSSGDRLRGLIVFEPIDFGHSGVAGRLEFHIASEIFLIDGSPLITGDNQEILGGGGQVGGIVDHIDAGCSTPTICAGAVSTLADISVDQIRIALATQDVGSLSIGENVGDIALWNRITPDAGGGVGFGASRQFILELSSTVPGVTGTVLIQGNLGPMLAIPEPPSIMLACLALFIRLRPFHL